MSNGFAVIGCKGWCGHVLNALNLKWSRIYRSSRGTLVSIGRNEIVLGIAGMDFLRGHVLREFSFATFNGLNRDVWAGQLGSNRCRSFRADSGK